MVYELLLRLLRNPVFKSHSTFLLSLTHRFRILTSGQMGNRSASKHYTARVRPAGSNQWTNAFVLETTAKTACTDDSADCGNCGYFSHLNGWTQSWLSLEFDEISTVEVPVPDSANKPE